MLLAALDAWSLALMDALACREYVATLSACCTSPGALRLPPAALRVLGPLLHHLQLRHPAVRRRSERLRDACHASGAPSVGNRGVPRDASPGVLPGIR